MNDDEDRRHHKPPCAACAGDDDAFFRSLPPGCRFNPTDEELIVHYLTRKVYNQTLPRNRITPLNLYDYNPQMLPNIGGWEQAAAGETSSSNNFGERDSYYFTPRHRKYMNGSRPNRAAGDGYWKATGADKKVENSKGEVLGFKKTLVFYHGRPPSGAKTSWIMHEYRVNDSLDNCDRTVNKMMLDNWVLCRVYEKVDVKNGKKKKDNDNTDEGSEIDEDVDEAGGGDGNDDQNDQKPVVGDRSNPPTAPVPVSAGPIRIVSSQNQNQNQNLPPTYGFLNQAVTPFQHHEKSVVRDRSNNSSVFVPTPCLAPATVPADPIRILSNPNQNQNLDGVYDLMNQAATPFRHHHKPMLVDRPNSPVLAPVPIDPIRTSPIQNQNQNLPPVYDFMNQPETAFPHPMRGFMNQAATTFEPTIWTGTFMEVGYPFYVNEERMLVSMNDPNNATMEQFAQQIVTCRRGFIVDNNDNDNNNNNNNNSSFSSNSFNYLENEDMPQGLYIQDHKREDTMGTYGNDEKPQDKETPQDVYKDYIL
ncbi:unnamed protein product [Cuscuta campestris]|uniref:NAC domain-containing protein n=1 Tax=Cuscuta campestris TaxID=132261 RepID=A0A484NIR3_9ASTE|nr:unnamed protein product [Cuscuta campestris]